MNKIKLKILIFIICTQFTVFAQNCKPDVINIDKITKQENKAWQSIVYESGFGNSLINTSDWRLTLQFGRYGSQNLVTLFLAKIEESVQNATYESQYKGEKGREYIIAFSQGEPIKLKVQATNTVSKIDNLLGKLVTTITISSVLTDNNLKDFKTHFDHSLISAIRVSLVGDITFEKEIKDKKAITMNEKFNCFYTFNSTNQLSIPEEIDLNNLPHNPNVPDVLPIDSLTKKISFSEIVLINGVTKEQLFNRAKYWMINYYKNEQFSIINKEVGRITKEGMFLKTYNLGNGKTETDKNFYNVSIYIKEEKYKIEITDITSDDGKSRDPLELTFDKLSTMNRPKLVKYLNQQIFEGVDEVINSIKTAMNLEPKTNNDW